MNSITPTTTTTATETKRIGYYRCCVCGNEKAIVSLTKKNRPVVQCHACNAQTFVRTDNGDALIREKMTAYDGAPPTKTKPPATAQKSAVVVEAIQPAPVKDRVAPTVPQQKAKRGRPKKQIPPRKVRVEEDTPIPPQTKNRWELF